MSTRVSGTCTVPAGLATFLLAAAASLSGCGSAGSDEASGSSGGQAPGGARPPTAAQADMVAAVSVNRSAGLVDLKFSLARRPRVGEPVEIELALTPMVDLERLFARFQVAEGLRLVSGEETEHLEHPAPGVPLGHKLTIVPKTDGIFYITAVVLADSDKESIARTFTIPIIAGQGLAELPAGPAAASVANPQRAPARP